MDEITLQKNSNFNWKVKLYLLTETGTWEDCGTGDLEIVKQTYNDEETDFFKIAPAPDDPKSNPPAISEDKLRKLKNFQDEPNCLLLTPLLKSSLFEKQGDSIISWANKDIEEEIALSFLDLMAAKEIWRMIWHRLGRNPSDDNKNGYTDLDKLPMPSVENLKQIKNYLETNKDWMICAIDKNPAFLDKLFQVFRDLEDLESTEDLQIIHDIVKAMVFSDDPAFLEVLLSDEYYMLIFGALEYDPEHAQSLAPKYREFLKNQSYYKKVIEFKDPIMVKKIHLNFRLSYLRDSVIGSIIDDPLTGQFNTVIYYNNSHICEYIIRNPEHLDQLFANFFANLKDSIGFLFELVQVVKTVAQSQNKEIFCEKLAQREIFTVITKTFLALQNPTDQSLQDDATRNTLKINLILILSFIIEGQMNAFVEFLQNSSESQLMLTVLKDNLFNGDQGLQIQITDLFKFLIDYHYEERNEILDIFYGTWLPSFLEHFQQMERNDKFASFVQQYIELLSHCVRLHGYRIRHYIIHHKLLDELYQGLNDKDKSTSLAIIRLVKNIVVSKDEFLMKYISKNNLLNDIFEVYLRNFRKDNLLSSACLDFFNTLHKENLTKLMIHFGECFKDKIIEYGLTNTFKKLLDVYEANANKMALESDNNQGQPQNDYNNNMIPEDQQDLNTRELKCMEDEDYFENEEEKKTETKINGSSNGVYGKERSGFLMDDQVSNADSDTNSEADAKFTNDNLIRLKGKFHLKKLEEEEEKTPFQANKMSRQSSFGSLDKIANKIDIQLNMRSMSEDNASEDGANRIGIYGKRSGTDLDTDEDIKDETKIEVQKRLKL